MWNNFWQQIGIAHYCYKLTFKFIVQLILQNSSTKFMECSMNTRTVTVSQVTKDTSATPPPLPPTNNYLTWIIFLVLFLTRIILLHAYPQVEYCTCVKFHQNWFIYLCGHGLAKKYGQTDWRGQIPIYLPKQLCLQEYYNDSTMNWCILGCSCSYWYFTRAASLHPRKPRARSILQAFISMTWNFYNTNLTSISVIGHQKSNIIIAIYR